MGFHDCINLNNGFEDILIFEKIYHNILPLGGINETKAKAKGGCLVSWLD